MSLPDGHGRPLAIGSRGSALAMTQARLVAEAFEGVGQSSRIVVIETAGDNRAPDTAWGEGAFVAAIELALLEGRIDVAVHSAKDVPTGEDSRLRIGAYLPRADPRDALVVRAGATERTLDDLPYGSRVGTDSPRRTGFVRARRPDLVVHPIHGNVDTRLRRLDAGETDALVLACAGLDRLGLGDRIAQRLDPELVPPAPGQGAIAVQVRDEAVLVVTAAIDDPETRRAVEAERALLRATGGGCRAPLGALARVEDDAVDLLVGIADPDGSSSTFLRRRVPVAGLSALVASVAAELAGATPASPRVLGTRPEAQSAELVDALRAAGLDPVNVPAIAIDLEPAESDLDAAASRLHHYRWVVVTSTNGVRAILGAAVRVLTPLGAPGWAAIGAATREALEREGIEVDVVPGDGRRATLAAELPVRAGDRVLVVRGDLAGDTVAIALRERGAIVDDVVGYRTLEAPAESQPLLREAFAGGTPRAAIYTSGSTVRGLVTLGERTGIEIERIPAVCIGPETVAAARAAGLRILVVAESPGAVALAAATAGAIHHAAQESR